MPQKQNAKRTQPQSLLESSVDELSLNERLNLLVQTVRKEDVQEKKKLFNKEVFDAFLFYLNGNLYWKDRPVPMSEHCRNIWAARFLGKMAGKPVIRATKTNPSWCITITLGGYAFMFRAHRIIWILHNGEIPENQQIDHINRNPLDNRIENLRLATCAQNGWNRGNGGPWRSKGKWGACISHYGISYSKINMNTYEEALSWRKRKSLELKGEFSPYYNHDVSQNGADPKYNPNPQMTPPSSPHRGPGRPKKDPTSKGKTISFQLYPWEIEQMHRLRGKQSRSRFFADLMTEAQRKMETNG